MVTPHVSLTTTIKPEWIDFNGHFNAGYYMVVFDDAVGGFMDYIGLTDAHRAEHDVTTFTLEGHITYDREVTEGEPIEIRTQLLGFADKTVHYIHTMHHQVEGWLAATNEVMSLHVSNTTRRGASMHPSIKDRLAEILVEHQQLPTPAQAGRRIGVR